MYNNIMVRKVTNWLQMYIGGYRIRSLMLEEWERGKGLPIYIYYILPTDVIGFIHLKCQ